MNLVLFLIAYELFLTYRAIVFWMFQFHSNVTARWMEVACFISELFMIGLASYMSVRNAQNDNAVENDSQI